MPRDRIIIDKFGMGMACNVSSEDINENAAFYCSDVNLLGLQGKLIGVFPALDKTATLKAIGDIQGHAWIQKTDGKWTLVFLDRVGTAYNYVEDFYGTPGTLTAFSHGPIGSQIYSDMIVRNSTVRWSRYAGSTIDVPDWVGYTANTYFGNTAVTTPQIFPQECAMKEDTSGTTSGKFSVRGISSGADDVNGFFQTNRTYYYRFAIEYDGYQMSPLSTLVITPGGSTYGVGATAYATLNVPIYAFGKATADFSDFTNNRITAILLFRAEGTVLTNPVPGTQYFLVERFAMDDARWTASGNNKLITYSDTGLIGSTYETYSGCSAAATSNTIQWGMGCDVGNYMFIGKCYSTDLEEAPYLIFRSVAGRFDMYNWQSSTPEFFRLPNKPTAICGYFGRLLIWDENNMYRINVDTLAIEEVISGYGCFHQQSLCVTKYGVFFADKNAIYLYDGTKIDKITQNIELWGDTGGSIVLNTTTYADISYRTVMASANTTDNPVKLAYESASDMLLVGVNNTSSFMYGYCVETKGWTVLTMTQNYTKLFSFITGKNGEVYLAGRYSTTNILELLFSSAGTRKAFTWISKRIVSNRNDESQKQKVYKIKITGTPIANTSIFYGKDSTTMNTALGTGYTVASGDWLNNYIHFGIVASAGQYVNDISVIFRTMIGVR